MSEYSLLLVDDDEDLLDSFTRWFSRRGFHVTGAHHPRLAMAATAHNKFDAAVVDITLPDMNGLELIETLKGLSDLPIIVLSGDADPKLLDAAIELGVYRFFRKPVSMCAIEEVVRQCIEDNQISASTRGETTTLESVS